MYSAVHLQLLDVLLEVQLKVLRALDPLGDVLREDLDGRVVPQVQQVADDTQVHVLGLVQDLKQRPLQGRKQVFDLLVDLLLALYPVRVVPQNKGQHLVVEVERAALLRRDLVLELLGLRQFVVEDRADGYYGTRQLQVVIVLVLVL